MNQSKPQTTSNILVCLLLKISKHEPGYNIRYIGEYTAWIIRGILVRFQTPAMSVQFPIQPPRPRVSETIFAVLEKSGCEADQSLQLVPRLRMSGVLPYFLIHLSGLQRMTLAHF